jgi:Tfp pilus assembly protein PilO
MTGLSLLAIQVVVQDIPTPPSLPPWMVMPPNMIVLMVMAIVAGSVIILWPLMRALGRRLEGRRVADPAVMQELESLRERVGELEAHHDRLAELEERVEFSERLLAKAREQASPRQ